MSVRSRSLRHGEPDEERWIGRCAGVTAPGSVVRELPGSRAARLRQWVMRIDRLVFEVGDRVTGWGWIRQVDGRVWFDPPHTVSLAFTGQPPPMSSYAVRLEGADPDATATDFDADGSIPGWATVTGVWRGDWIQVETQSPVPPPWRRRTQEPTLTRPPCRPPAGGRLTGVNGHQTENLEFDPGDLLATGAAVTLAQFRPGPDQLVIVVAAADEQAVERWLRPQLGPRLCVVRSRWTRGQLDAVTATLRTRWRQWTIETFGEGAGDDGQAYVETDLFRVPTDMADWAAGLPDELLRVKPVLTPAP